MAKNRFKTSTGEARGKYRRNQIRDSGQFAIIGSRKYVTAEEISAKIDRQLEEGTQKILRELGLLDG